MKSLLFTTLALLFAASPGYGQQSHFLIVSGLGGEPQYSDAFHQWGIAAVEAARSRYGLAAENVVYLAERPERDPARINAKATKENVEKELLRIAGQSGAGDQVFILLLGHGSAAGDEASVNLPGPDLNTAGFARLLERFGTRKVTLINTASASGPFVERLSGKNRTIITATRSGLEQNETVFGRFFVQALAEDGADTDKDGRVSMLEAFDFARHEVARSYREQNRLQTEHALLDDNGDGQGSTEPGPRRADGALAQTLALRGSSAQSATRAPSATASPELRALYEERTRLEREVEALRARKDGMDAARYQQELERLLVELAQTNQEIRRMQGNG